MREANLCILYLDSAGPQKISLMVSEIGRHSPVTATAGSFIADCRFVWSR